MEILLGILFFILVYILLIGKFMLNVIKKLSDILTSDNTFTVLRIIIYTCLFILVGIFSAIFIPWVIYG